MTPTPVPIAGAVALSVQRQEMTEWCWSAMSVSVNLFFRPAATHTQCGLAGDVLNLGCCDGGKPAKSAPCNAPHDLNSVLGRLHLLAADPLVRPLTFDEVRKEIDCGRPVCVLIKWLDNAGTPSSRGHFLAINGYRVTPALKQFVSLTDPFYGASDIDFNLFSRSQGGYRDGHGVWFASFLVNDRGGR